MENVQTNQQDSVPPVSSASTPNKVEQVIPKTKLIETLKSFLEKPEEEILFSEIEAALRPFWENHPVESQQTVAFNPEAMNKLAELIKKDKEKNKT